MTNGFTGPELESGMVITIEPMVNAGSKEVLALRDGWTIVTSDGSLSAQWEHTALVTDDGVELLTECDSSMLERYDMPSSVKINALCHT